MFYTVMRTELAVSRSLLMARRCVPEVGTIHLGSVSVHEGEREVVCGGCEEVQILKDS